MRYLLFVVTSLTFAASCPASVPIINGVKGNRPTVDHDWPAGTLPLANLEIRLGWWEGPSFGGGQYHFLYRGDTKKFADALDKFGKIIAPRKELIIREGEKHSFWLKEKDKPKASRVDWRFIVCTPSNWYQLYNDRESTFLADQIPHFRQPLAPPKLEVYLTGTIDWSKIKVPAGVTVIDERLSSVGLTKDAGAVVRGAVFDMQTSKPIPNATIQLKPRDATMKLTSGATDQRGNFDLRKVPPGTYGIVVRADGYVARRVGYEEIGPLTLLRFENVQLVKGMEFTGKVADSLGSPVPEANVRLSGNIAMNGLGYQLADLPETKTDKNGAFVFESVPPGYCHVSTRKRGYSSVGSAFAKKIVDGMTVSMEIAGMLRVRVRYPNNEMPTGDHIVEVTPEGGNVVGSWGGSARINARGEKIFRNVPPGKYTVSAYPNPRNGNTKYPSQVVEFDGKKAKSVELVLGK